MTVDKNVTVDLSHVQPHRKITIHENDVNSVYIVISVVNNGSSVSLSGLTIKYDAVINDFLAEQDASGSVDTTNNTIRIPVTTNMTAMSGILRIDIRIISGTEVLHTQTITAIVEKSVVDGSTIIDFSGINIVMRLNALESAVAGKENQSNKVTSLPHFSTDTQYPSAKCVYNELKKKQNAIDQNNPILLGYCKSTSVPNDYNALAMFRNLLYEFGSKYQTTGDRVNPKAAYRCMWHRPSKVFVDGQNGNDNKADAREDPYEYNDGFSYPKYQTGDVVLESTGLYICTNCVFNLNTSSEYNKPYYTYSWEKATYTKAEIDDMIGDVESLLSQV